MRRLEIEHADIHKITVQQEIMRSEESRYDHRLHGILLICNGFNCYEVSEMLGHSPRTIEYWVRRFEESGFAGLEEGLRTGRPGVFDDAALESLGKDLRRSPRAFGYDQNIWDGKLLSHHLRKKEGIHLGVRQCQRLFRKLGFRRRKPRGVIAHADPGTQATYKKTPSPRKKG